MHCNKIMKTIINKISLTLLAVTVSLSAFSQMMEVKGYVYDAHNGAPLPGVTVTEKKSNKQTITDSNGKFNIKTGKGEILHFQFIGFQLKEMKVESGQMKIYLQENTSQFYDKNAVMFRKIIEPVEFAGVHNLRSKNNLQKKFFPDNNGLVEFFEAPSFRPEFGFRVVQRDSNLYVLEIKQIGNWQEINNRLDKEYPLQIPSKTFPKDKRDEMNRVYKKNVQLRRQEEGKNLTEYDILSKEINISKTFAVQLHNAFVYLIKNHDNRGPSVTQFDGSQMTFRCVVENELWSFTIGKAFNKIDKLTEICNEIVQDSTSGNGINEEKYLQQLKELTQ